MVKDFKRIFRRGERNFKKEEKLIFHQMRYLKKHHQAVFAFLIVIGVVFIWRGVWNLIDRYWFPSEGLVFGVSTFSDVSGIIFGMVLLFICHQLIGQLAPGVD